MSCCVQPAGIDGPGVVAVDGPAAVATATAVAAGDAAAPTAVWSDVGDGTAATGLAGTVVQFAWDPGAHAAMPATTRPPPATAAPRRKPRLVTALSSGLDVELDGLTGVTVSVVAMNRCYGSSYA